MANLYELTSDLREISEIEDIDTEQVEQIKAVIKAEIDKKSSGIVALVRNLEGDVDTIKAEIDRLNNLKKVKENRINNIKNYTKECLEEAGIKKVSTSLGNISIRKTPGAVEILDEDLIPTEYKSQVVTVKVDKKAILAELKEGVVIQGVNLKTGTSLTIK